MVSGKALIKKEQDVLKKYEKGKIDMENAISEIKKIGVPSEYFRRKVGEKLRIRLLKDVMEGKNAEKEVLQELDRIGVGYDKKYEEDLHNVQYAYVKKNFPKYYSGTSENIKYLKKIEKEKFEDEERFKKIEKETNRQLSDNSITSAIKQKLPRIYDHRLVHNVENYTKFYEMACKVANGEITLTTAINFAKKRGMVNPNGWWERYFQLHPPSVIKRIKQKRQAIEEENAETKE